MTAGKRRAGFGLLALALAAALLASGAAYLLWALGILLALAAVCAVLIRADAQRLSVEVNAASGARVGRPVQLRLTARHTGAYAAAGYAEVELEICNVMFGTRQLRRLVLPLRDRTEPLDVPLELTLCGETALRCVSIRVWDLLGLFSASCEPFHEVRTVCYPPALRLELALSRNTVGAANAEGLMQNRRGSDPSEIFDIREYQPGDDVRAIHWKLSCKTDTLILREPSEPSHYDMVLLPDLGLSQGGRAASEAELNSAAALLVALGEQLLARSVSFCLAIPTGLGLEVQEVPDKRTLHRLLPQWLGLPIRPDGGTGLDLFRSGHLERYFTRLLIVSAGVYGRDVNVLGRQIGVTVISTSDEAAAPTYTALGAGCEAVVLPSGQGADGAYKIVC